MARKANPIPSYLKHQASGKARIRVTRADGSRQDILLPGQFGSQESKEEYQRILVILQNNHGAYPTALANSIDLSVAELSLRFTREKIDVDFVKADGSPSREQECFRHALKPLNRLYGNSLAKDFDAEKLESVQAAMATGAWLNEDEIQRRADLRKPIGWCRNVVNKDISRIRSMFKWAVRKKLVPVQVLIDIGTVEPVKVGRGKTRETPKVLPVDLGTVESTIPGLPPVVRDMVQVQLLTGMRPGEVCSMLVRELDQSGPVWIFRPTSHKTLHHGHQRAIAIGPKAQAILSKYAKPSLDSHVFSPAEQAELIRQEKRAYRKTKIQPSQVDRSKPGASRLGNQFTVRGYGRAIERACKRKKLPHWHPNQLRHLAALLIEREFGLEAARATLGHRNVNMSAHYSGIDHRRAADVVNKIG